MPSTSRKAMRLPSGDHAAPIAEVGSLVSCRTRPVDMSRIQMSSSWPPRSVDHARNLPSGDHAGSVSRKRSFVRFWGFPPIGMSQRSPSAANATDFPSGEMAGAMMPFAGSGPRAAGSDLIARGDRAAITGSVTENGIVRESPPLIDRVRILPSLT
jgi:hypothetical protein